MLGIRPLSPPLYADLLALQFTRAFTPLCPFGVRRLKWLSSFLPAFLRSFLLKLGARAVGTAGDDIRLIRFLSSYQNTTITPSAVNLTIIL